MMKKVLVSIMAIAVVGTMFIGCGESDNKDNANKKYLIATDAKYAPFEFEQDGKYVGIDVELLDAIAKVENFNYELKPMDFDGIIPGITSNQLDGAIAGINMTDERKKILDLSDTYFEAGLTMVVKSDNETIKKPEDLKGKIFAVKKGTAGAKFAEDNKDKYGATIKYFEDSPATFLEVANGNADVTFEDYPVIAYKLSLEKKSDIKIAGEKVVKGNYVFAVNKGKNAELLKKFNEGLKKLKENGEYDKIVSKYIKK
ncbi:polar amino acid transport system substrate-binding protein [Clostridium cavendishii DSM 21758]|uniref:Polar amino acid transport system substrate-binding protein n=1 Tax=Clostridium cavendishii DSM 21758 TaxID=1121302 RepID=A0A1M6D9M9_9CLOT|nr:transporter substrate-binding domain-containing protein [Clostridium cavendishii]SHI69871.1 polar amino acid transport system substrate-binding protein [Clostridium cavendishii DSM 21758]